MSNCLSFLRIGFAGLVLSLCGLPTLQAQQSESDRLIPLPALEDEWSSEWSAGAVQYDFDLAASPERAAPASWLGKLRMDYANFYDRETLARLAAGVGVHAAISNTNADEWLRHEYQERLRGARTDEWAEIFHSPKIFGEGSYLLPAYAATALIALPFDEESLLGTTGEWGERSLRTVLVGAPPMLGLQWTIGASRPTEEHSKSHWEPFHDDNGVSGHAFMGAIPFLSAAKMTDKPVWKAFWYLGSTMPAFSRVNDDDHYTSQALLGWSIAYLASTAVADTYDSPYAPSIAPGPVGDGSGLNFWWKF